MTAERPVTAADHHPALRTGASPYQHAGDLPVVAAAAGLWLIAALHSARRPGRAATEPA